MELKAKIKDQWPAIAILAIAAAARLTLLAIKPPHFDEGVNGWFVDQMQQTGFYHYDPTNYHGPFHFYVLFLAQALLGRHIWALRLPLALMGVATVWLTIQFDRFIGRAPALWAAAAMAVSPGCVFYSRYAIHEYWLVFALMLGAWGMAGLWNEGKAKYLWALWIGITLAVLTKETYAIHFAAAALTVPCVWALDFFSPAAEPGGVARQEWMLRDITLCLLMFAGLVAFFYSGGFMDLPGLKGLYQAYGAWAQTGRAGNGHEKVWYYWLTLFGRYEWPTCAGLAVAFLLPLFAIWGAILTGLEFAGPIATLIRALGRTPRFIRALAIYGAGALAAYSIINYKTPWCVVSLTWPFLLLFGYGADFALRKRGILAALLLAVLLGISAYQMAKLNFVHFTDALEPYVYVQTFPEIDQLMKPLNQLVASNPSNYLLSGHIMMESYHPIPWLLGDFPNVGYWDDQTNPPKMDADFLMVDESRIDDIESKLHEEYFTSTFRLRDAEDPSKLYLNVKTFQSLFPGRKPGFIPPKTPPPAPAATPDSSPPPGQDSE